MDLCEHGTRRRQAEPVRPGNIRADLTAQNDQRQGPVGAQGQDGWVFLLFIISFCGVGVECHSIAQIYLELLVIFLPYPPSFFSIFKPLILGSLNSVTVILIVSLVGFSTTKENNL